MWFIKVIFCFFLFMNMLANTIVGNIRFKKSLILQSVSVGSTGLQGNLRREINHFIHLFFHSFNYCVPERVADAKDTRVFKVRYRTRPHGIYIFLPKIISQIIFYTTSCLFLQLSQFSSKSYCNSFSVGLSVQLF
jgi:hypothetical protein